MFLDQVIHFGQTLGDQVKGRSPKKLKWLIEVPNLVLISSPVPVLEPSYPFLGNFVRTGKGSFTEKSNIVTLFPPGSQREVTCSKLQYNPYLTSVACLYTELSICGKIWAIR